MPLIGQSHQDFCEGHAPLPNGDCWFYTDLTCAQHDAIFQRGPGIFMDFAGSPGHYILKHPGTSLPVKKDFVVVDDRELRRMDSAQTWLNRYREAQKTLGPALSRTEYRKQKAEFDGLVARPDARKLSEVASNPRAAFREEAKWLAAELDKPVGEDRVNLELAERCIEQGRYGEALQELLRPSKHRNPDIVRIRERARWIEWTAAERLMEARAYAGQYNDVKSARATYEEILERFPGTPAHAAARKELEAIR